MFIFRFYNGTSLMVGKQIASPPYIKKLILELRLLLLFCPSFAIVMSNNRYWNTIISGTNPRSSRVVEYF